MPVLCMHFHFASVSFYFVFGDERTNCDFVLYFGIVIGEVLLYQHNQHQVLLLFESIRQHMNNNTFEEWTDKLLKEETGKSDV